MKNIISILIFFISVSLFSQNYNIYNPHDNAQQKIESAIALAKKEKKFVLLQIGGNWCRWCLVFNKLTKENPEIEKILNENFIVYHLNYSKQNKNEKILEKLGSPQRFGFPVFVILNEKGERIHIQQSDLLENGGEGYDIKKVAEFLLQWSPSALHTKSISANN